MRDVEASQLADNLQQLGAFHQAVAVAHHQAVTRVIEHAMRTLRWLTVIAHETAQNAWQQKIAALQDYLAGLTSAAEALSVDAVTPTALAAQTRAYWNRQEISHALRDLLAQDPADIRDLASLHLALTWFFDALIQAAGDAARSGRSTA